MVVADFFFFFVLFSLVVAFGVIPAHYKVENVTPIYIMIILLTHTSKTASRLPNLRTILAHTALIYLCPHFPILLFGSSLPLFFIVAGQW